MLITLLFAPVFFVLGILFGLLSPLMAIYKACQNPWSKKWQAFVSLSSKISKDHENLVKHGTDCIESFECIKPCRNSGQHIQLHYYKLGHSLSVLLLLFILTFCKVLIFAPIWSALIFGNVPQQDDLDKLNLDENNNNNNNDDYSTYSSRQAYENNDDQNWNNSLRSAYSSGDVEKGTSPGYGSGAGSGNDTRRKSKTKRKKSYSSNNNNNNNDNNNNSITNSPANAYSAHGAYD